jgi:hypothetical protein
LLHITASLSMYFSDGQADFFKSPQITDPHIHGLILPSQIRKFLQNTALLCLKTVLKIVFKKSFFIMYKFKMITCYTVFARRKSMYLRTCGSFKQITNKIGSANRKSAKCLICGRSAKRTNYLRFAEVFCGPPTFGIH